MKDLDAGFGFVRAGRNRSRFFKIKTGEIRAYFSGSFRERVFETGLTYARSK